MLVDLEAWWQFHSAGDIAYGASLLWGYLDGSLEYVGKADLSGVKSRVSIKLGETLKNFPRCNAVV